MGFIADIQRAIENHRADKDNRRRGQEELRLREVEALEAIARAAGVARRGND